MKKNQLRPTILHEHDDFIIIDKPSGLLSVADRHDAEAPHLRTLLRSTYPDLHIVHRLDKDTSGVMVIAKHAEAHKALQSQFERRRVNKTYVALVRGSLIETSGVITASIKPDNNTPGRMMISEKGKASETSWRAVASYGGYHFMKLYPKTGRTHQLRIHMAHIGLPIVADPMYGRQGSLFLSKFKRSYRPSNERPERPLMGRTALHAQKLVFDYSGERFEMESPLPKDFKATRQQLEKVLGVIHHEIITDRV